MQDVLGLGTEARMNIPNTTGSNWSWRIAPKSLTKENAEWLAFKDLVRQKILAATNPSASAPAQTPPTTPKIDYSPVFNASFYRSKYADLSSKTDAELLQHFEMFGMNEFRQASKNFNPTVYKAKNSDLQPFIEMTFKKEEWNMQYYLHYINYGRNEGRVSC